MKAARAPSEAGAFASDDAHTQGGLRKRVSPDGAAPGDAHPERPHTRGPPPGLLFDEDAGAIGASHVSPYHPHYNRPRSDSHSADSVSSAEEAGVVDAGCFPPGTIPGSGKRPGDRRQEREEEEAEDAAEGEWVDEEGEEPEEHEILESKEARRWGFRSGEVFPRLFAEDSASEDSQSDSGGSEGDGGSTDEEEHYRHQQQQRVASGSASGSGPSEGAMGRIPQLRSRVRRGSEGYEVRPMMYDHAYARQREDEEQRLREYLMRERERLGTGVKDWREWHVEGSSPSLGQREEIEMSTAGGAGAGAARPLLPSEIMARRAQEVVVDPGWGRVDPDDVQGEGDDGDDYGDGDYGARPEDRS